MNVIVNRTPVEVAEGTSLAELLAAQGVAAEGVAAARNNRVVPRTAWGTTPLAEGDRITVISAVCGG